MEMGRIQNHLFNRISVSQFPFRQVSFLQFIFFLFWFPVVLRKNHWSCYIVTRLGVFSNSRWFSLPSLAFSFHSYLSHLIFTLLSLLIPNSLTSLSLFFHFTQKFLTLLKLSLYSHIIGKFLTLVSVLSLLFTFLILLSVFSHFTLTFFTSFSICCHSSYLTLIFLIFHSILT
jgi:hypothetical protein